MSIQRDVTDDDKVFVGEVKTLRFVIYQADGVTPQDISGYAMQWILRRKETDQAVITKTTAAGGVTISGVYNVDPAANTQRALVALAKADTTSLPSGAYDHALERTDVGLDGILTFGDFQLRRAAAR